MSLQTGSWAQLRQQARSLETQTENLFSTYSQFSSTTTVSPKPSEDETKTESQLEDLLEKRSNLLGQLTRLLDSEASQSAVKSSNLARHREILSQHRAELARIKSQIAHTRDRANLLSNIRSDIDNYRSANPEAAEAEYMLDERRRVDNSHNMVDGVLSQAYAVNENFNLQRETLTSINRRIVGAASQIPGMNSLMSKIGNKKRRDGIILGSFIAFCFLVLLYFT
ncbi:V-snare-domain-containing protein [Myriangium duriaei CBS 260.36]|uniref:Golgi SNAP receptor complex member 1 n=1 Tax=Myriangium duriaei CBS 260.36 TaxID=1168546 RepID=A0A9P4MPE2_9PEZI|nr:V-snare-domain-containing protein [Myriangium duriaei CBS 260.36]